MSIDVTTEKRFEADIEEFFLSSAGGYTHNNDMYDPQLGVYKDTLLRFIQRTQPKDKNRGGKPIRTSPPKKETAPDMTEAEIIKDLTETEVQSNEPS